MVGDERERKNNRTGEEPDVEAHAARPDEPDQDHADDDDKPDVEAHHHKGVG